MGLCEQTIENEHLKAPNGAAVTVVGGTVPKQHDGWMWDLTVPGNNDHDFYIVVAGGEGASGADAEMLRSLCTTRAGA
jgi:hypothetical protein